MKGRVRLHSGGISPGEVRLRPKGATARKTAPGKDIRDYEFEDPGAKLCGACGGNQTVTGATQPRCVKRRSDEATIRKAKKVLSTLGVRSLDVPIPNGAPGASTQRKALAARARIAGRRKANAVKVTRPWSTPRRRRRPRARTAKPQGPQLCSRCNVLLPSTGVCDECA